MDEVRGVTGSDGVDVVALVLAPRRRSPLRLGRHRAPLVTVRPDPLVLDLTTAARTDPTAGVGERRARDAVSVLSRRYDDLCTSAVDPWEIAAGLEAEGINDRDCIALGHDDVFGLAEALFDRVPRRGTGRRTASTRLPVTPSRSLMRGLIYALPALVGVGLIDQTRKESVATLLVAVATGWGWSQAWSYLGHHNLGWVGDLAARVVLRTGVLAGLVVVPAVVVSAARVLDGPPDAVLAGIAVGSYMVGAGALLVLGDDRVLLAALVPGSLAGLLFLLGRAPWQHGGQLLLAATSLVVVIIAAFLATGRGRSTQHPAPHLHVSAFPALADLPASLAHLSYGVICAAAVGLGPITFELLRGGPAPGNWYVALPVVLSMGAAELHLERLMATTHRLLGTTSDTRRFVRGVRRVLVRQVGGYLGVVAVLSVCALVIPPGPADDASLVLVLGYAALAGCFFLALVLVSVGRVTSAAACLASAVVVYVALAVSHPTAVAAAYAATFVVTFLVLLLVALLRLRSPLVHL